MNLKKILFKEVDGMPFVQVKISEAIEQKCKESESFRTAWEESREEYRLIGEMVSLRKSQKVSQSQLARLTGNKQQVISRIEKRGNCPTLKTFCNLLNVMGYELRIVKREKN